MKRLKFGFLTLIAIITFGFTVSERFDVLDHKNRTAIPACFRSISAKNSNCTGSSTDYIEDARVCPGETNGLQNKKLWGVNTSLSYVFTGSKPPDCSAGTIDFCCATVVEDTSPCPGQPQFDLDGDKNLEYYKIVNTYCRP